MTTLCTCCNNCPVTDTFVCTDCIDTLHGHLASIDTLAGELEVELPDPDRNRRVRRSRDHLRRPAGHRHTGPEAMGIPGTRPSCAHHPCEVATRRPRSPDRHIFPTPPPPRALATAFPKGPSMTDHSILAAIRRAITQEDR